VTSSSIEIGSRRAARLNHGQVEAAASQLVAARSTRKLMAPPFPIETTADAYAVQDAVAARLGPVGGWKVGAKGPDQQPNCAPLLAALITPRASGTFPASTFGMIGIEAEIAFTLGRDIVPGSGLLSRDDVLDAVAAAHPAVEVVDTRLADWRATDRLWLLADNLMNGHFVYGAGVPDWRGRDFTRQPVRLQINGKIAAEAIGGNAAGDPLRILAWLVNHCRANGLSVAAGTVITTGSCTGMIFVEPGAKIVAEFPGFGSVAVDFPT
jgi:2-keto-4-pentenoate hydratase